ncbi:hypothetical protein [Kitasatospora sp. NPDC093558]|uniref:hypothetical protein n=1 Tax=Kitasatospora sp. NPDC093558 TaxID=3155201 RepID=UPI003449EEE9
MEAAHMRQLDERAVHVLTAALKEIPLLENADRRADLVHSIRQAPGVVEFEVTSDNATHTHLTRITRSCINHSNPPAARKALYEEARRLAGGQRAVSWLGFFNAVLDSRHPERFRIWLLDIGGWLRTQGWGSSTAPGVPDPLSEFTWLVAGGSQAQILDFCRDIEGLPDSARQDLTRPDPPRKPEEPEKPEPESPEQPSRRKWWVAGGAACAVVLAAVIWAVVSADGDRPAESVPVVWDMDVLSEKTSPPNAPTQTGPVANTKVDVPAGRTRLVLPLNLSDSNPNGGACHTTTVDVSIDGQTWTGRRLDEAVRASVPAHRTSVTLTLTLRSPEHCSFQIKTNTVNFEG